MSARRSPVRMGVLNLLVMVIALCLAVLAVLSLVTARAGQTLSERQAHAVQEIYVTDAAGQQFVASVDAQLDSLRASQATSDHAVRTLDAALLSCALSATNTPASQDAGVVGKARVVGIDEFHSQLADLAPTDGRICFVQALFTTSSQQNLDCVLAINDDLTYDIVAWRQSHLWDESAQTGESLMRTG